MASSVKEMGPGSRRDTMDDHFQGDWNWKKTKLMGVSLLQKIKVAVTERNDHRFLHNQFEVGLPQDSVKQWRLELDAWERDHKSLNPYQQRSKRPTQDDIRQAFPNKDVDDVNDETGPNILHADVSTSVLISMGLDLEEQQHCLAGSYARLGQHVTEARKNRLQVRTNALCQKISAWIKIQHLYMPGLSIIRAKKPTTPSSTPHHSDVKKIPLYLPSAAPKESGCDPRLHKCEWQLRHAQANDTLDELRDSLRLRSYLFMDKNRFQ
ncbi:hypothetical protein BD779DRAFT_1676777 [Infundibulicybe gibba]|nr:hypothetical protein BD779DRAFT_1676777 [Infundibulicybe gibba]